MAKWYGLETYDLRYMHHKLVKLFNEKVDDMLLTSISGKLSLYIIFGGQDYLENFVEEYFKMERIIVTNRNALIDLIKSDWFKDENLISKLKLRKELKYWQKLCDKVNMFEKEFYERTNISLLRIENERWAKEKKQEKENEINQ